MAVALMGLPVPDANACGSYGPPTEEEEVTMAATDAFWVEREARGQSGTWLQVDSVAVTKGRVAVVSGRVQRHDGKAPSAVLEYALYNVDGTWTVATSPQVKLLVTTLKHALDANIKTALDKPHDAVKLPRFDAKPRLHSLASLAQ